MNENERIDLLAAAVGASLEAINELTQAMYLMNNELETQRAEIAFLKDQLDATARDAKRAASFNKPIG